MPFGLDAWDLRNALCCRRIGLVDFWTSQEWREMTARLLRRGGATTGWLANRSINCSSTAPSPVEPPFPVLPAEVAAVADYAAVSLVLDAFP
jgi:hypothetical protein